ncbi:MAG: vacuolar H+transporting two-sector ATPase F subunit [Thaumarchaeota archaeon RBG_16_49_8]|nr:MAG: vacuolar H+transporting two-sector ATPase F subunit [Thaumarchaeota archaeon RBG_16_49_8]
MKVFAIGGRAFVSGFRLAGVDGIEVSSPKEALSKIKSTMTKPDVGLIIVSDDFWKEISDAVADLRVKQPIPLVYNAPAPGSKQEKVEYRELIKRMLKIG